MTAPLEASTPGGAVEVLRPDEDTALPSVEARAHEAFRARRPPPAAITERPNSASPDPKAVWIKGYWEWDDARQEFAWAAGGWRVPPAGRVWVDGAWKRDEAGWYRVPGKWAERLGGAADWRRDGPPDEHPADIAGPAPGPGMFHVPGIYVPEGERLAWKPGFWAASRPGWDWVPARWVRRADGWRFRPGSWQADAAGGQGPPFASTPGEPDAQGDGATTGRHVVARPAQDPPDLAPLPDVRPDSPDARPDPGEADADRGVPDPGKAEGPDAGPPAATAANRPPVASPSILVLPDGRRVRVVEPGAAPRSAPGGVPSASGPAPRRGLPLIRSLLPQRRDPRRRGR